jgi:hypothetical protein
MSISISCQKLDSKIILSKCISVHDPDDQWQKLDASFDMSIKRDGHADRFFSIYFNRRKNHFKYLVNLDSVNYSQAFFDKKHKILINRNEVSDTAMINKYNLKPDRTKYLQEVYEYLFGVPMVLKNDLLYLSEDVGSQLFNDKDCHVLTFDYLPKDNNETWLFFINKSSYLLEGYQFFDQDIKSDGEFIFLKDQFRSKNILFPREKHWYWNKDDSFFRTDSIIKP